MNWMSKEGRDYRYKLLLQESRIRHAQHIKEKEPKKPIVVKKEIDWEKLNSFHNRKNIT